MFSGEFLGFYNGLKPELRSITDLKLCYSVCEVAFFFSKGSKPWFCSIPGRKSLRCHSAVSCPSYERKRPRYSVLYRLGPRLLRFDRLNCRHPTKILHTDVERSQSINQSINWSISQLVNQSVNQSIDRSVSQSVSWSISQSVSQAISQSIDQSVNQSVSQSIDRSGNQSVNQSFNQSDRLNKPPLR